VETHLTLSDEKITSSSGRKITSGIWLFPPRRKQTKFGASGITLVGCVPEVMDFKELVLWCVDKFDIERRIIQVQGKLPISLTPFNFHENVVTPKPHHAIQE
jgi:hypothetical protein